MSDLQISYLGTARQPKKRKRFLELIEPDWPALEHLPDAWRQLLVKCLRLGGQSRWQTWQKLAGLTQKSLLDQLYEWLLRHGHIVAYEYFENGLWWPYKIEWQHETAMRKALGLPIASEQQSALAQLLTDISACWPADEMLARTVPELLAQPVKVAHARALLLKSLIVWKEEQRTGSHRDFSLYARGDTKAITSSEWEWLAAQVTLADYGIQSHHPLLYLSANMQLEYAAGILDISAGMPFVALPAATFADVAAVTPRSSLSAWVCVENLTSFERLAAQRTADIAVLWLPGFAPAWWQAVVTRLITLCPAPLRIACDPDPAGICIAQQAMQLWQAHHLDVQPWRMGVAELQACKHRKPLNAYDQVQLQSLLQVLPDLHPALAELAQYMQQTQEKAEQESYL